jgi:guanylate kinase
VIVGPSGVGKGTVVRKLLERDSSIWRSVSATTRAPRAGEVDGVDYQFVTREAFDELRSRGGFLEDFEVFGHSYGTPRAPVQEHLGLGRDVVLEIDVQGALAVKRAFPDALLVFVKPPSREEQRRRLIARGVDDPAGIERRLAAAETEEAAAHAFDAVVVNDDVDTAVSDVAGILEVRRSAQ